MIRKKMFIIISLSFSNTLRFFSKIVVYVQCASHCLNSAVARVGAEGGGEAAQFFSPKK